VWLNAEHIAHAEGWASPLVLAGVLTTLCACLTSPAAERCARDAQPLKAACLWLFFGLAVTFSLTASIARSGGHRDAEVADAEAANMRAALAREAYQDAKMAKDAECKSGRGKLCRKAEDTLEAARQTLAVKTADPGAERVAAVLAIEPATVALYSPFALPLGLELGGFIFLAVGLSPRCGEEKKPARKTKSKPKGKAKVSKKPARLRLSPPLGTVGRRMPRDNQGEIPALTQIDAL